MSGERRFSFITNGLSLTRSKGEDSQETEIEGIKCINSLYLTGGGWKESPLKTLQERETRITQKLQSLDRSYWLPGSIRLIAAIKSKLC